MPLSSQTHQTLNIRVLRNLVDQEISDGTQTIKQSTVTPLSPSDTATSKVLGLDIQILAATSSDGTRRAILALAKTTPLLLAYAPGPDRQQALQATWQLCQRISNPTVARSLSAQPTHVQTHFLATKVREMPMGPRPYVRIDYIPCEVVPLVDYWPDFVRWAFALGCWRFAGGEGVVLEIMEGRLDLVEWLIEMEEKKRGADSTGGSRRGAWPVSGRGQRACLEEEGSSGGALREAAWMLDLLRI